MHGTRGAAAPEFVVEGVYGFLNLSPPEDENHSESHGHSNRQCSVQVRHNRKPNTKSKSLRLVARYVRTCGGGSPMPAPAKGSGNGPRKNPRPLRGGFGIRSAPTRRSGAPAFFQCAGARKLLWIMIRLSGVKGIETVAGICRMSLTGACRRRREIRGGAPLLLLAAGLAGIFLYGGIGRAAVQPIAYSHKQHIALGLHCVDCHSSADTGAAATLPSVTKCMLCHAKIAASKPEIQKLAGYAAKKQEVPWQRVYGFDGEALVKVRQIGRASCREREE